MTEPATPERFYRERIPAQFNRALDAQQALGEPGAAPLRRDARGRRDDPRRRATGAGGGTFFLNIRAGRMSAEPAPPTRRSSR